MNATTYPGTGATNILTNGATGQSFQPDLVWIKSRTNAYNHALFDSVRGANKQIASNATDAEVTQTQGLMSFNSNGFTLGTSSDSTVNNAGSGQTYVAWQWKAGGAAVTNTAGTISSQVSANTTSGFSVVTYTANGASAQTIGHGLGVAPAMVITKCRSAGSSNWGVYHKSLGNTGGLFLNTTNAFTTQVLLWNNTTPTSSVFTVGSNNTDTNFSTNTMVAYCFSEVAGYSAFGSYTGNGSADGPFVYTGFRPRFILYKSSTAAHNWVILDTSRDTYNVASNRLFPSNSNAEATSTIQMDILSNGFKIRVSGATDAGTNASGETYIYMAFAENPFKYANAR
jgi:hypothetical protein